MAKWRYSKEKVSFLLALNGSRVAFLTFHSKLFAELHCCYLRSLELPVEPWDELVGGRNCSFKNCISLGRKGRVKRPRVCAAPSFLSPIKMLNTFRNTVLNIILGLRFESVLTGSVTSRLVVKFMRFRSARPKKRLIVDANFPGCVPKAEKLRAWDWMYVVMYGFTKRFMPLAKTFLSVRLNNFFCGRSNTALPCIFMIFLMPFLMNLRAVLLLVYSTTY